MTGQGQVSVLLSPMFVADLPAIVRIEALSIPRPWPMSAHKYELETNADARHIVARIPPPPGQVIDVGRLKVVGFGSMWLQADEAHVTMIAVHPDYRRRKIGQRLLVWLIREAMAHQATLMTLEVRAKNEVAALMYRRFGFVEEGRRKGYYSDSGEDAIIMTTPDLTDAAWLARLRLREAEVS